MLSDDQPPYDEFVELLGHDELAQVAEELMPSDGPRQLDNVLESVRQGNYTLKHAEAYPLLKSFDNSSVKALIPTLKHQNRVPPEIFCTFFVHATGTQKRSSDSHTWLTIKKSNSCSYVRMAQPGEGVVRFSMSGEDEAVRSKLTQKGARASLFALVALPNHPQWKELSSDGPGKDKWRYLSKKETRVWLVNIGPGASPAAAAAVPPAIMPPRNSPPENVRFGTVDVDDVRVKGVSLWDELLTQREQMKQLHAQFAQQQQQQQRQRQLPSSSHRADLAEWMAFAHGEDPLPRPGDLVECLARGGGAVGEEPSISRAITGRPGATLFVVSTAPAWAGNMPEEQEWCSKGAVVAFLGRVPVRVHGTAPINSFLVPSGRSDGTARAVTPAELQEDASLRAQCFGVVWAQLPPDAEGTAVVLAFVSASPIQASVSVGAGGGHGAGGGWGGCGGCGRCGGGSGLGGSSGAACGGTGSAGSHEQSCSRGAFGELHGVDELALLDTSLVPMVRSSKNHKELRPYQQASIDQALSENTIVNLPTGTGKTLIAIKVLDEFRRRYQTKKVLFVVPQVSLVRQQSRKVREDGEGSPRVAELCGATLDGWTAKSWKACVAENDVLLGTPATFYNAMLTQGVLRLSEFSLIVFDECHEATGDSAMAKLMREVYWPKVADGFDGVDEGLPHVLGLTASIVAGKLDKVERKREKLETLLQSSVFSPDPKTDPKVSPGGGALPSRDVTYHRVEYARGTMDGYKQLVEANLKGLAGLFSGIAQVEYRKATNHAEHVLVECGMSGLIFFLGEAIVFQLERRATVLAGMASSSPPVAEKAQRLKAELPRLRESCKEAERRLSSNGELTAVPKVSYKCRKLLEKLVELFSSARDDPQYKGLVFVEQVALAPPLAHMINQHMANEGLAVRAEAVSGVSSMSDAMRQQRLDRFHGGELQLLVCTQALEQGTDVPSCAFVVRYSKFDTTKSHVQGSGRARRKDAQVFYFENSPPHEESQAAKLEACARDESLCLSRKEQQSRIDVPVIDAFYPYRPTGAGADGATVTLHNCVEVFHIYCGKVMKQNFDTGRLYDMEHRGMHSPPDSAGGSPQARAVLVRVRYPTPKGFKVISVEDVDAHWGDNAPEPLLPGKRAADVEKRRFLYTVVVRMSQEGYLDAHNGPSAKALAAAGGAADASTLPEQLTLNDTFAPEAGQEDNASSPAASTPEPNQPTGEAAAPAAAAEAVAAAESPMVAAVLTALADSASPPDKLELARAIGARMGQQITPKDVNSVLNALEKRGAVEKGANTHGAKPTWVLRGPTTPPKGQPGRAAGLGGGGLGHPPARQPRFQSPPPATCSALPSLGVPMTSGSPGGSSVELPQPPPPPARWLKSPSAPPSQPASSTIAQASGYTSDDAVNGSSPIPRASQGRAGTEKAIGINYKGMLNEWCQSHGATAEYSVERIGPVHEPQWVARLVVRSPDLQAEYVSSETQGKKGDAEKIAARLACNGLGIA